MVKRWQPPKQVKVGGNTYSVLFQKDLRDDMGNRCDGLYSFRERHIALIDDPTASNDHMRSVFLHEVLHAIWDMQNIPGTVDEETAVQGLERGLITVFKDNPRLMEVFK